MRKKDSKSIDGMLLKRQGSGLTKPGLSPNNTSLDSRFFEKKASGELPKPATPDNNRLNRSDIDASLSAIGAEELQDSPSGGARLKVPFRRIPRLGFPKITKKRVSIVLIVLLLMLGAYFGAKLWMASSKVFDGGLFGLLGSGKELKEGPYGRSNILIFGTSADNPNHPGRLLTDSMMVVSVDQDAKNVVMFSVPRDLWVDYDKACLAGYEGKINALYRCYSNQGDNHKTGAKALRKEVGEAFGIDVQYSAAVNYSVVKDLVNAVGGITVNIDSPDPRGILDRNFDWKCNYTCYYVKYDNGPAQLNGADALYLARARNASGGYGLPRGNFDREQNQRKIMRALREKALDAGTLANPIKISGILDALGNNLRTNFSGGEVKTLIDLAQEIKDKDIKNLSLVDAEPAVVTTDSYNGQSIVRPVAGMYDFSEIQEYLRKELQFSPIVDEDASIIVLNGGAASGMAGQKAESLEQAGFINVSTSNTGTKPTYDQVQWYDLSGGSRPHTASKLKEQIGEQSSGSQLPEGVRAEADFVIILGNETS